MRNDYEVYPRVLGCEFDSKDTTTKTTSPPNALISHRSYKGAEGFQAPDAHLDAPVLGDMACDPSISLQTSGEDLEL